MIRIALLLVCIGLPALAEEPESPISEAGTAFMRQCLVDVAEARIALLRKQAPDFAASLSADNLEQGARQKAMRACPCFLHMIGTSPVSEGATPEEKVAVIVAYLDALPAAAGGRIPPVLATVPKRCGERASMLPPRWYGR